ncbi:MAG TPA: glycerol-3-phosphate 1-O-acyltransferase PlsY [Geminicoccaceae bacterium]
MLIDPPADPSFWWPLGLGFLVGYLIGAIPFGLLLTRVAKAGDLRLIGSGNIGATNVLRTGRKGLALATLLLDIAKGALPTWLAFRYLGPDLAVLVGLGAVLGHCFPLWLKFRGGKGVATAAGVLLALTPLIMLLVLALFLVVVWLTRFVSLGSILAALAAPLLAWLFELYQIRDLYVLIGLVVVLKHHANIRRLAAGRENKVSFGGSRAS